MNRERSRLRSVLWFSAAVGVLPALFSEARLARAEAAVSVTEAVVSARIENLAPVGISNVFPHAVGRVYFFTRVKGLHNSEIKHLWFHGDAIVMEVTLPVNSPNWRTFSFKSIHDRSVGDWRVDVTTEDGTVLASVPFRIE